MAIVLPAGVQVTWLAPQTVSTGSTAPETAQTKAWRERQFYSGLSIVLKRKITLSNKRL